MGPAGLALVCGLVGTGCTRAPAVQPYGTVATGGKSRPLSAKEVAPVDDFLNRHQAVLGILAAPAPATTDPIRAARPARTNPAQTP